MRCQIGDREMWQPIETAPKDRSILVFCNNGAIYAVRWGCLTDDEWVIIGGSDMDYRLPNGKLAGKRVATHWTPLPAKPESHNAAPAQHETATSAEKHNETD